MKGKSQQIRNAIFYVLVAIFALPVTYSAIPGVGLFNLPFSVIVVFCLLGVALVVLTVKLRDGGTQKIFFILTGASAAGMPTFGILHNLVYGLCIYLFGKGFWGEGDEPVFFILTVFVCPVLFAVGTVGSIALLIKARVTRQARI